MNGTAPTPETTVPFRNPARFLADLDPETTGRVIASAADVALILDEGIIQDVALGNEDLSREGYDRSWRGKPWIETVTVESRPKIEDLLRGVPSTGVRWRQVNHPAMDGLDVPIKYTAMRMDRGAAAGVRGSGRIVALGRDLRAISRLQQRLVEAHQGLERDYSRLRSAEARYKLLFQSVAQPLLIVDPTGMRIEEANPAAEETLDVPVASLTSSSLVEVFTPAGHRLVSNAVAEAVAVGHSSPIRLEMKGGGPCELAISAFREDEATRLIVHLEPEERSPNGHASPHGRILGVLEDLPDGLVVAGADHRILAANRAFIDMAHLVSRGQLLGGRLSDYLGRSATDLNVLISNLKNHGVVRNFTTVLRDRFGNDEEVEVSAVSASVDEKPAYGFSVRNVARRLRSTPRHAGLPNSVDQLTGLVGRVPLREIVRESADFIEKLCIEAALEITDDNRASAAEMLGLSRQGLYSKLKRFGFDEER